MILKKAKEINLYQFNNLSRFDSISHFVSGRSVNSDQNFFNLSYKVGDAGEVERNRALLADSLNISPKCLIFPEQTHSVNVAVIDDCDSSALNDTDAIITKSPGICVSVMSADCVPILLYDPKKNVVGAIHSGWRGTVGQITTRTVEAMMDNFSCNPKDIAASIGPSICKEVYEVGDEVVTSVRKSFPDFYEKLVFMQNGEFHFDLWHANYLQLIKLGILEDAIEVASICTYENNKDFFSARKEGLSTGRFAAGIVLK